MSVSVKIIVPEITEDALSEMLCTITEAIARRDPDLVAHGFLGGEFGYGAHWNSPVFEMRPFYWGDCTCGSDERCDEWCAAHPHAPDCYSTELEAAEIAAGVHHSQEHRMSYDDRHEIQHDIYQRLCAKHGVSYPFGCAVHCTCGRTDAMMQADLGHRPDCALMLPNFLHRRSGLEVRWYKYIGRDMEVEGEAELSAVLAECLADIGGVR